MAIDYLSNWTCISQASNVGLYKLTSLLNLRYEFLSDMAVTFTKYTSRLIYISLMPVIIARVLTTPLIFMCRVIITRHIKTRGGHVLLHKDWYSGARIYIPENGLISQSKDQYPGARMDWISGARVAIMDQDLISRGKIWFPGERIYTAGVRIDIPN